eukprot:834133-Amphidinium_carterae.4
MQRLRAQASMGALLELRLDILDACSCVCLCIDLIAARGRMADDPMLLLGVCLLSDAYMKRPFARRC